MSRLINLKIFKTVLYPMLLLEGLSFLSWKFSAVEMICFTLLMVLTLILSLKKIEYGLYILFAELFVGSKGYLFYLTFDGQRLFSIRMGLFIIVMAVFLSSVILRICRKGKDKKFLDFFHEIPRPIKIIGLGMTIILIWSIVWGLLCGNSFDNVFLDFNNWLYWLILLPVLSVPDKNNFIKNILSILSAAVVLIFIKSTVLLYLFSHDLAGIMGNVYCWVRDTGIGEITSLGNGFWRIFIQSQIYSLFFFFIIVATNNQQPTTNKNNKKLLITHPEYSGLLITLLTTILLSFSRSYWLAFLITLLLYYFITFFQKTPVLQTIKNFAKIITPLVISLFVILAILSLPPHAPRINFSGLFGQRTTQMEAGGSSRLNQLKPLSEAIKKHIFIGSGLGATITYQSTDPRILPSTAGNTGEITTYASEWGYLDMWFKFGLIGLFIYLYLIWLIIKKLLISKIHLPAGGSISKEISNSNFQNKSYNLRMGFALALFSLLIVNIFSPYLNHPLGIGFLILSFVFMF